MATRSDAALLFTILTIFLAVAPARAQPAPEPAPPADERQSPPPDATAEQTRPPGWWTAERRACEGCPPRSVGKALLQTTFLVNLSYELANLIRGQVTARITPKTWWANMEQGWVWDLDDFTVNQVGHPYQGSNYFNAGRANGLSFWESSAVTAFGSATWEYFGETNHASLNDFINTTLGGIALGEVFHRAGWLVRNTHATGRARLWSEIGATALDPLTGINRFWSGDASRVADKPADLVPASLNGIFSAGALWRGTNTKAINASGDAFLETDLLYGDLTAGRSRTPYDAFSLRLMFGGGSAFSEARVQGRLFSEPFAQGRGQFMVVQGYEYQANDAYRYGAQSFNATVAVTGTPSPRTRLWIAGWGGVTVLGAVDSLPVELEAPPEEPETPEGEGPGQGVSEGPRYYDYGPGGNFGALATLVRDRRRLLTFAYEARHLYSLDGVRANHFLQRLRLDLQAPVYDKLGIGVSGEYFDRRTYYQDATRTVRKYHYPQIRAYLTWSMS